MSFDSPEKAVDWDNLLVERERERERERFTTSIGPARPRERERFTTSIGPARPMRTSPCSCPRLI